MNKQPHLSFRPLNHTKDLSEGYRLMQQLRPHLTSETDFLHRWQRQAAKGYCLNGLFDDNKPVALAGYRIQENLLYGRFLYIDDLITETTLRNKGHGEQLITCLHEQARASGCKHLVLDTALTNLPAHRFYTRCGLHLNALHFNTPITA